MEYLVKCFVLMSVASNTCKCYVRRWVRFKAQDSVFKAKNQALKHIAKEISFDYEMDLVSRYKYTLQCIKGGKHGKR